MQLLDSSRCRNSSMCFFATVNGFGQDEESGSDDSGHSSSSTRFRLQWATLLEQVLKDLGHDWPEQTEPLTVLSARTGCAAEAATLKARSNPILNFPSAVN